MEHRLHDHDTASAAGGATTLIFPDLPKAFSSGCPLPWIKPDAPDTETDVPTEPPEDEPQA